MRLTHTCFLDASGETKDCHDEETSAMRDFDSTEAKVRCWQTLEGARINCTIVRAPDPVQYDLLELAKKSHGEPLRAGGKPVEGWVFLVARVRMVDHR